MAPLPFLYRLHLSIIHLVMFFRTIKIHRDEFSQTTHSVCFLLVLATTFSFYFLFFSFLLCPLPHLVLMCWLFVTLYTHIHTTKTSVGTCTSPYQTLPTLQDLLEPLEKNSSLEPCKNTIVCTCTACPPLKLCSPCPADAYELEASRWSLSPILYKSTLEVALVMRVAMPLEIESPIGVIGLQHVRTPLADVTVFAQYGVAFRCSWFVWMMLPNVL